MAIEYDDVDEGMEFLIHPQHQEMRFQCCDCGLTHVFQMRVDGDYIRVAVNVDHEATQDARVAMALERGMTWG